MATTFSKESFLDLKFNNHWVSEYGLVVVSDGSRYSETLFPDFTHTTATVPGKEGTVYWGTTLNGRTIVKRLVTDGMTARQYTSFKNNFRPGTYAELRFGESLFKYGYAYISENSTFSFVPFETTTVIGGVTYPDILYKGDCDLIFFMPDPNFYSDYYISTTDVSEYNYTQKEWFIESGLPIAGWLNKQVGAKQLALGNWHGGTSPASTRLIRCYHAGNAIARANLSFKKTYGTYTDANIINNLWSDYQIDDLVITIPRAIRDIKITLEISKQYNTAQTWDNNKNLIIKHLEDNLDSSIAGVLRAMVRATGSNLQYTLPVTMRDIIRQNFINGKTYLISINGIEMQSRIQSVDTFSHPITPPGGTFIIDDSIDDSINNKYITLAPQFGVSSSGTLVYQEIVVAPASPALLLPEVYFRNTYE